MPIDPNSIPSNKEIEAQTLLERAEKKVNSFGFFGLGGSRESKLEEAADMCAKAGNLYKIEKKWKQAGEAYEKAADYALQMNDLDVASSNLVEASKSFKKVSPEEAIKSLTRAVEMLKERGRFHPAANYMKQIGEIYESDIVDPKLAMQYYEEAADLYSGEDSSGLANQCWLKVATFAAQLEQYDKAIEKFESVAATSLDNNLTKYSAKNYFLNAGLCHLCKDPVGARKAVEKYQDLDSTFSQSRECQLLLNLLDALEAGDQPAFTGHVADYDRMSKLDPWKTTVLLRVKRTINEEPSLT
ncbi:hypothetical protein MIR68_006120 [Amoeboaphelidium protococcarum]|nr:hypothetical protein MIR68_006120 [Amoeboaphelidium protococcarum]